ncbi:hypothetical protein V6N11_010838 [Hibiscus sabdariffa]|uniref:WAT1-related protein n=1 Tax=Hibiscus sabdariffa TaxID=183260 RepID=A0ABR2S744_9ROSI
MVVYIKRPLLEDVAIIGGLVGVQFVYAGNSVLHAYLMSLGLRPFPIVICFTLASATFFILSPFAFYFERSQWPNRLTLKFITQLVLISFGGLEKVVLSCLYNKVKIAGTFLCVLAAITMSLMQSIVSSGDYNGIFNKHKIIGCMYLMAAVLVLSSNVVLQAKTLGDFPAPMSLCAITSLIGVIITSLVQLFEIHDLQWGSPLVSGWDLLGFSLLFQISMKLLFSHPKIMQVRNHDAKNQNKLEFSIMLTHEVVADRNLNAHRNTSLECSSCSPASTSSYELKEKKFTRPEKTWEVSSIQRSLPLPIQRRTKMNFMGKLVVQKFDVFPNKQDRRRP